jgi:hypothetical protein
VGQQRKEIRGISGLRKIPPAYRIGEHESGRSEPRLEDPIDQAISLRSAVKELLAIGLGPRSRSWDGVVCGVSERLEQATSSLWKYRRWPDRVRSRRENIRKARVAVRKDYTNDTVFQFSLLPPRQRRALADDIFAMYEACLLDIGRMHERGGLAGEWYNVMYPKDAAARTIKLRRDASPRISLSTSPAVSRAACGPNPETNLLSSARARMSAPQASVAPLQRRPSPAPPSGLTAPGMASARPRSAGEQPNVSRSWVVVLS